jgi:hypothetical protein
MDTAGFCKRRAIRFERLEFRGNAKDSPAMTRRFANAGVPNGRSGQRFVPLCKRITVRIN